MDILAILRHYNIRPSKGLGQNFLVDESVLERILEASDLSPGDIILEVGPGTGLLTRRLAQVAASVIAIELDRKMLPVLAEALRGYTNVHIIQGDILELNPVTEITRALEITDVGSLRYQVIANLPYYITSAGPAPPVGRPRPT